MRRTGLEQIKDFYLTAEAIGERNADEHFDELLAQQRELISEYFRQSGGRPGQAPSQAAAEDERQGQPRHARNASQPDPSQPDFSQQDFREQDPGPGGRGEPVIAEPPSTW